MRVAGRLAAEVLQVVAPYVKPGVTTAELDRVCHVNIDVTVIKDGWHGDTSRMYYVGTPSAMAKRVVEITRDHVPRHTGGQAWRHSG